MARKGDHFPVWMRVNAWREIFTRIFQHVETKVNVYPEWLINPATRRRLKLDIFCPEIGVAVRFEGLQGKQRRQRPSLEEEIQQRARDNARVEMCQAHGINLIVIDAAADSPKTVFQTIDRMLSRAGRRVKDIELAQKMAQARAIAATLSRRIEYSKNLKLYAELWEDRQYQVPEPIQTPTPANGSVSFTVGMEVEHITFGPGVVLAITPSGDDTLLTVDFVTAGQKTLAASLVSDKLLPR